MRITAFTNTPSPPVGKSIQLLVLVAKLEVYKHINVMVHFPLILCPGGCARVVISSYSGTGVRR